MTFDFYTLKRTALANLGNFGSLRWFRPKPRFWKHLEKWKHVHFIDTGTGRGDLPMEARARGFRMTGIDILRRDGMQQGVRIADALDFVYDHGTWPLVCRPSHDGWTVDLIQKAKLAGAHCFYVGLSKNIENDTWPHRPTHAYKGVGEEGEKLLIFTPNT